MAKLTREELYELVWTTPMRRLALEYGISDVALAKTCRRLNVPHPGRGYWARVAAGEKVKRSALPKPAANDPRWTLLEKASQPKPMQPVVERPNVKIATDLKAAAPIIKTLARELARSSPDAFGRLAIVEAGEPVLVVTIEAHRRALLMVDALCRAAAERGYALTLDRADASATPRLVFNVDGEEVSASLVERLEAVEHTMTHDEQVRARAGDTYGIPRQAHRPDGRLQLGLKSTTRQRLTWTDAKNRTLDRQLGSVLLGVESEVAARRTQRVAEEERRRQDEERRRVEELERQRKAEEARRSRHMEALAKDLREMAARWRDVQHLRDFLAAVRARVPEPRSASFEAWLAWADGHLDELDPVKDVKVIAKVLAPDI